MVIIINKDMDDAPAKAQAWDQAAFEAQLAEIEDERAKKYIDEARSAFKLLLEYSSSEEGWKKSEEKSGVQVFTKKGDEGVSIIKGKGNIPFPPEEVRRSLTLRSKHSCGMEKKPRNTIRIRKKAKLLRNSLLM